MPLSTQRKHPPRHAMPDAAARAQEAAELPVHRLGESGLDGETAYELISSELLLDGSARLEPGHVRHHVHALDRGAPDGGDGRQEHDRQGRVSADGGDRVALREHPVRPVELARPRAGHRLFHHRLERGLHAGRPGAEVALARADAPGGKADRQAQPGDGHQRPGVLGEVLPLLGRGAAPGPDGGRPLPPGRRGGRRPVRREHDRRGRHPRLDVRRQLRADQGDRGRARPARARARHLRPDARGRRLRRVRRTGAPARPRVGLPDRPGAVDQRLGPQVRARLPRRRLGDLAQPGGAAARPRVRRELPGRPHADVRAELLPPRAAR